MLDAVPSRIRFGVPLFFRCLSSSDGHRMLPASFSQKRIAALRFTDIASSRAPSDIEPSVPVSSCASPPSSASPSSLLLGSPTGASAELGRAHSAGVLHVSGSSAVNRIGGGLSAVVASVVFAGRVGKSAMGCGRQRLGGKRAFPRRFAPPRPGERRSGAGACRAEYHSSISLDTDLSS